jgi:hypothetical protein
MRITLPVGGCTLYRYRGARGKTYSTRFKNYTNGAANWNNFLVVLTREDNSEYTVLRADNLPVLPGRTTLLAFLTDTYQYDTEVGGRGLVVHGSLQWTVPPLPYR